MKPKACVPCAKRKVRCNGEYPCCNCKRRKQDHCAYPTHLASPSSSHPKTPETLERAKDESGEASAERPLILRADGRSVYLESPAWQNWNGKICGPVRDLEALGQHKLPPVASKLMALESVLTPDPSIDLRQGRPAAQVARSLWEVYDRRVNPLIKITFDFQLRRLRNESTSLSQDLTHAEHALLFAIYFTSVRSLSEEECTRALGCAQSLLLTEFQHLCEQALVANHFFTSSDLMVLQAVTLYICAGFGVMGTKSLQSLVGLAIRNGERIGLHRDGSVMGLSPFETEQRRRLWWQLQQLDLGLSVESGSTSLTLTAEWDTRIPLSIEDRDIESGEAPSERRGTTSMSYCRSTYWVIEEMQRLCRANFGKFTLSWPSEKNYSMALKRSVIDQLEAGLNTRFLQYCDPVRPLDVFMQLQARMTICTLRRFMLHPIAYKGTVKDLPADHRQEILDLNVKCLEYDIALNSNPTLAPFQWRMRASFPWSALIYVLIESCQSPPSAPELWTLITDAYDANPNLSIISDDRRKTHAAKLLSAAWKVRAVQLSKPRFLCELEAKLHEASDNAPMPERYHETHSTDESYGLDLTLSFDPNEIDWMFWDSQLDDMAV